MPPEPEKEVEVEDVHIDQQSLERSEGVLDKLFGGEPEKEVVEEEKEDVVEEVEEEEESSEEEGTTEEEEEEETDWDASDDKDDVDPKNETAARKQAKLKGREAKELKTKLTERELELDRIQKERDDLKARLEEVETTRIKPEDHPEYTEARDSILADARSASRRLPGRSKVLLPQNFGTLMSEFLVAEAAGPDEIIEADAKLAGTIADSLELTEVPYKELDEDERAVLQPTIDKVVDLLERNAGKTKDLQKLHGTLSERAKTGLLSTGVRNYENTVKEFKPVLDSIGDLADDVIESNPHAVESLVAKMVKSSPEAAKRLEKAKADVLEALVGPRALTQKEIDKLESNGADVKQFLAERAKAHRAKQQKLAAMFVQGLMTRATLKETMAKLSKYETEEEAEDSEFDAIRKTTKKKATPVEKEVRPKDRPSALTKLFGDLED